MRLQKLLRVGILLVVFVRQGLFAQCGQTAQKPVSTLPKHGPTPKIAKRKSRDRFATGVLACVSSPTRVMVSPGVMGCFLFNRVEPVYPAETENANERLTLGVVVGKDGRVLYARKISGPENLVPAAIEAVKKWEYRPYLINGEPIEVDTTVELPAKVSSCVFVSWPFSGTFSATIALPSWLFNTRPVMPVLASQGTPK
jgi:hypothetical protein